MTPVGPVADGIQPLMEEKKYTEAEALVDHVLKLLGDSPTPESPAPAQQPGATSGSLPPSLQAKIARLRALAEKREGEGFDMAPVAAVADGVQPLIDQQKFAEAEAQVDRALKLLGETTPQEQPHPQSQAAPPQSLQQKVHRLQALIERREQAGADMQPVGELMEELDPLLRQQKYTEAEALVDRALKLLGDSPTPESPAPAQQPGATSGGVPPSLQAKMARLQALAEKREAEGFNMEPVGPVADGIQPLMEQKKYAEAEALVDRVLKLLGDSPTPESPAPAQQPGAAPGGVPPSLQAKMARVQALAQKREAEGFDMAPVAAVGEGVQPLLDQQKFAEAEALVDRVLKLLGDSPTPESPAPAQQPGATPGGLPPSLQAKIARLQALAEKREAEGFDMEPVAAIANGIHPLIEQKKYAEAEAQVDRALKLLGETTPQEQPRPQNQTGPPQSLQQKVHRLQALIERREQEGADLQPVGELMQGMDPLMQQQKYTEAEALVDRALKLLGESTPEGQGSSHDAKHP
jgi:negative regulator of replication initiation